MKDKAFLDTNIFVYAIDSSPELTRKRNIARELIREQIQQETGVISIQVVQEFFQVSTQRIETPITTEDALLFIQHVSVLQIVAANVDMVVSAVHLHKRYALSLKYTVNVRGWAIERERKQQFSFWMLIVFRRVGGGASFCAVTHQNLR